MASRGAARNGRGGYQKPRTPAPASGPGAMSARTDGGPADRQPLRAAGGQGYGEAKAQLDQQRAAPLRAGGPSAPPAQPGAPAGAARPDIYAPTDRPSEPITSGAAFGAGPGPEDPLDDVRASAAALLQAVADVDPSAARSLLELIEEIDNR